MSIPYERLVEEDLSLGYGDVTVTMPGGGTATGRKVGLHTFTNILNIESFGAVGDEGATDNTTAIQAAFDAADLLYQDSDTKQWVVVLIPSSKGFGIRSTVTCPDGVSIIQRSPLIYVGNANTTALMIGTSVNTRTFYDGLTVIRQTQSAWSESGPTETNIGIQFRNLNTCDVWIREVRGFTIGVQFNGYGSMMGYNTIKLGMLLNNKVGLDITNETVSAAAGASNENLFLGGRFAVETGIGAGLSRYGVRITSKDDTYTNSNQNVFVKPSFEMTRASASPGETIPIRIEHGIQNYFLNIRSEGNSTSYVAQTLNGSAGNVITSGYDDNLPIDQQGTLGSNVVEVSAYRPHGQLTQVVEAFQLRALANRCNPGEMQIMGMSQVATGDALFYNMLDTATLVGDEIEVSASGGIGIRVDTSLVKQFVLWRGASNPLRGGRVLVRAYDSNGAILTSAGANHPYVKGASGANFSYAATFGGAYQTGNDSAAPILIWLHADVKSIWVGVIGGTASALLRSIVLTCDTVAGAAPGVYTGLALRNDLPYATVSPTVGPSDTSSWPRATQELATAPVSRPGWVCVSQVDTTLNGGEPSGETVMAVAASAGMAAGDIVGVRQDDGTTKWTTIASVDSATQITLSAALTDDAATGNAVYTNRWARMALLS